jgi:hypothetical protein
MNLVPGILSKPRLAALVIVAFAILATASFLTGAASASSSGGVGTTTPTSGDSRTSSERVGNRYARIWDRTSRHNKRWAKSTSRCESGGDPDAIGGGGIYRGAFQFMKATWKASPKSPGGDPIAYPYKTQAVVAVALKKRDGAGHWPVCG